MFSVADVQNGSGGGRGEHHGDDGGRRESEVGHGWGVREKRLDEEETTFFTGIDTTTARIGMFGIGTFFLSVVVVVVFFFFFLAYRMAALFGMRRRLYKRPQWHVCDEEIEEKEKEESRQKVVVVLKIMELLKVHNKEESKQHL